MWGKRCLSAGLYNVVGASGLERLQQFLEAVTLDGHIVKTHVYRVTDATDVYRTLRQIDASQSRDGKTFIIDMTTTECEQLLRKIVSCRRRPFPVICVAE